jgi:hypothetical protein
MILPANTNGRLLWLGLVLGLAIVPAAADAEYRQLCSSIPTACDYTGPDAPKLDVDVCYGSATGARLKTGACPTGTWAYHVTHGEVVDPASNEVAAYVPLDDACATPGICVDGPPPPGAQAFPICCTSAGGTSGGGESCQNWNGSDCGGTLWFCDDGVSNLDGTVSCFSGVELS